MVFGILAGLVSALPSFLLKFIGSGTLETVLSHQRATLDSANERERIDAGREVKRLESILAEKQLIKDLQIKELEHPIMWVSKFMLVFSVCLYWSMRFQARTWGFDDFSVEIKDLTDTEGAVSMIVMGSLFVNAAINKLKA